MWEYSLKLRNKKENLDKKYAGVYALYVVENGHKKPLYVGSSIEIQDRLSNHLCYLRQGNYRYKEIQEAFNNGTLKFVVLDTITFKDGANVVNLDADKKEYVFYALSRMEEFYMELFKDTILNKQKKVKQHSTANKELRSKLNSGENNPACKYSKKLVQEIIWLRDVAKLKVGEIVRFVKNIHNVDIANATIYSFGKHKWKDLKGIKPEWFNMEEI